MNYLTAVLSGFAATFIAIVGAGHFLKGIGEQKATGLGAVSGGLLESIFSPLFWILAVFSFALFFTTSRLSSKVLRVFLFWTPTLIICILGFGLIALLCYAWAHSPNS